MGGHGGLNILPQKKWNVYNWDNKDIVEKDKREHAEKERKKYQEGRQKLLKNKLNVLKKEGHQQYREQEEDSNQIQTQKNVPAKSYHSLINMQMKKLADQNKHVNLFEEEQKILANRELAEIKRLKTDEFLKDKNMDYSSKFLGTYNDQSMKPWYSKKKGAIEEKNHKRKDRHIEEVIPVVKTSSKVTKQVFQAQKQEENRFKQIQERDRTRQKYYQQYEDFEDRYVKIQKRQIPKQIIKHEEDLLIKQVCSQKISQIQKLRLKRLKREEKERRRAEQLKRKME